MLLFCTMYHIIASRQRCGISKAGSDEQWRESKQGEGRIERQREEGGKQRRKGEKSEIEWSEVERKKEIDE